MGDESYRWQLERQLRAEIEALFGSKQIGSINPRTLPKLAEMLGGELRPDVAKTLDSTQLRWFLAAVLREGRVSDRQDQTEPKYTARHLREGVRGFLLLPTAPDDVLGDDLAHDGFPSGRDLDFVKSVKWTDKEWGRLPPRQAWAGVLHARVGETGWVSRDTLEGKGRGSRERYQNQLLDDLVWLLSERDQLRNVLQENWTSGELAEAQAISIDAYPQSEPVAAIGGRPEPVLLDEATPPDPSAVSAETESSRGRSKRALTMTIARSTLLSAIVAGLLLSGIIAAPVSNGEPDPVGTGGPTTDPIVAAGWGPDRPILSEVGRTSAVTLNSVMDNPVHGDERNFVQIKPADAPNSDYVNEIVLEVGRTYTVSNDFRNDAKTEDPSEGVAQETRLIARIPAVVTGSGSIQGHVSAENATPHSVWDSVAVMLPDPNVQVALRLVPGSATITSGGSVSGTTVNEAALLSDGAYLGCDVLNGLLPGDSRCSGNVTYDFVVDQSNFDFVVGARVAGSSDAFTESVTVQNGNTLELQLTYRNVGTTRQNGVFFKREDVWPDWLDYELYSVRMADGRGDGAFENITFGEPLESMPLGDFAPGEWASVRFGLTIGPATFDAGSRWLEAPDIVSLDTNDGSKRGGISLTVVASSNSPLATDGFWTSTWGPEREMYTIESGGSMIPTFNSITDNPNLGDERNFVGLRSDTGADIENRWFDQYRIAAGDEILMRVFVNNSGYDYAHEADEPGPSLEDVRLRIGMSKSPSGTEASVYGLLSASNANSVWDGATLHFDERTEVSFDLDWSFLENNGFPNGGRELGGDAFGEDGVLLGYDRLDGLIPPGYQYDAYVTVRIRATAKDGSEVAVESS